MVARKPHKYNIGEIVNGLQILNCLRYGKKNKKGYEVQSVKYPEAPTYNVYEDSLQKGDGCAYTSSRRIFEGNSLYATVELRPYIVDIEQAKKTAPCSNKKMKFKCPECNKVKEMAPTTISHRGFNCSVCSSNTSYPELFIMAYLEIKGIEYEYQKVFDDLDSSRFDFYIPNIGILEAHGIQHYDTKRLWYEQSSKSDIEKRKYCRKNNINLIELDCRKSNFDFIREEIYNNTFLENIKECEIEKMLEIIKSNKNYPVKDIISLYEKGNTVESIGSIYGISDSAVYSVLKKHNAKIPPPKTKVRCITTNKVFDSITDAANFYNTYNSSICRALDGSYKTAGKFNGERLKWDYVKESKI